MTTNAKIELGMVGATMVLIAGVYTFFAKRIDNRSEEEHQAMMAYYERNYGIVADQKENE